MSFTNLAKKRCSIRAYDPDPVEPDKIAAIVEAAHVAPSAANRQPVRLIQVESAEGLANLGRYANLYGMVSTAIDASITCDHMMIEATDLGLGSVWICAFDPAGVREAFNLPASLVPVNILAVGHAADEWKSPERHAVERIPVQELVTKA